MELITLICPNSSSVWQGNGFSECFSNIIFGFGVNFVTLVLVAALGVTTRNARGSGRMYLSEKVFLHFLPALEACMSFFDMVFLAQRVLHGDIVMYDEWLFRCSQFLVWMIILVSSKKDSWCMIFCNRFLCFWWIAKSLLGLPHLQITFSSLQGLRCFEESCVVFLDIIFGIFVNINRIKRSSFERQYCSMDNPLLSIDTSLEEGTLGDSLKGKTQSYWHLLTFKAITSVMNHGVVKQLDFEDLLQLPIDMDPSSCHATLLSCWHAQQRHNCSNPSLFRAICCAYGWPYFRLGLLKVVNDCIGFVGPVLLNNLIRFLQQGSGNLDGYILAVAMGLIPIFKSFLDTQYTFHLSKLKLKLRSSIMTVIYHKCLCVNLAERSKFSEGEIQTFMSVDADRIVNLCNSFHDMWSLPLQIGLALYLLYTQVKFAFVSGIAITILLIPVNKWISKFIARATEKMMKKKDERISKTAEILAYIRTLKMYGWELLFMSWLMEIRSSEVKHLSTRKYLDAWCVFFWATTPTLFSLFTFGLFTLMGYQLDAAMVFTCLALFNTLISPLNSFPWVINGLIDAIISTRRLSRFLSCSEHKPAELEQTAGSPSSPSFSGQFNFKLEDMAVAMYDASCAWSSSEEVEKDLVLHHVTLGLPRGSLVAIIGEVGSGKSSLLNSILKEMRLIHGSIYSDGSITYVPQVPWILSGTIRENILFGKAYDPTRYSDVLEACALDIDISLMVGGDMAYIGDKGVNLSGGQRARLALARAIYHGSDIFMLDDVLSAVDTQVARCILHNAILGPLMNQHTRVLCTHNIQAMSSADMIVVMDKGHVKWVGSSTDFSVSSYSTFCSLNEFTVSQVRSLECSTNTSTETKQDCKPERDSICVPGEAQEIIEVELRKEGRVELTVYKSYATYSGWFITVVICLSAILMQASRNGNDLWLSYWVDTTTGSSHTEYSTSFYLVVLCIFCVINSFLTLVRAFSFAFGGLRAAVQVHNTLLSKLINAPVHFFDKTPGGRILNRMSSDLYTIDDSLPFILNILLANIVGLLGIAIVLSYVQVVFLLLLLPFWYVYSKIQFYYRSTSRELRRLDSVSRSPIFASFTETLDGSSTIRAFKCEDLFFTRFSEHVALYQQTSYSELIASLWLSLRLQLLAALVISFVAMMAVIGSRDSLPISLGTPGLVGLALSYAAPIVSLLGSFLTSFTETEKEMVSVERVLQYMDIPQEELNGCQSLSPNWPSEGYIMFQNVSLRYLPSLPDALHDITFTISGGTQVGIIGRTGAGKSSILNALFRLTPICKGCILVDGLDIADVPVRDLRSHFAVVPQSPFLFEGSLRDNLDPFRVSDDLKIWKTLERCHVKEEVEVAGGLDIHVKESGTSFSVGQRQLLCLARALLKSSKVLCLDECTANIDAQTSSVLQNAILTECRGMTVITIAHRISTVLSMDNILILDRGILVEQGNPQVLLQDHSSRFSGFAKASTM
ncbi:ABC transporter C family member 13 isoform X4 [Vitis vinifera]|uniref:ABC transporter C family member 13 isoform X4 n=1 Tax=Vitis vinifera TaxID=29760 RepID=UPI00053F8D85|nr:ABC transporter C family member 13 isoform X4 [Vitis vinifera]|eukprot:XP_010655086.1 PREDICTED: ABC transporter C family member 13 isoform X3 [Vitis vinifera]